MKQIGRTNDNKHLVEMTDNELVAFNLLSEVADGKIVEYAYPSDIRLDTNLVKTFTAIRLWIEQTNTVNQLQGAIDRMKTALRMQGARQCTCDSSQNEGCSNCPE